MRRTGTILALAALLCIAPVGDAAFLKPSADSKAASTHPRLSVDPVGRIYALWEEEQNGRSYHIFLNRSVDGGVTWQKEDRRLDQDKPAGSWSSNSQIRSDGKGHVYIAWRTKHQDGAKDLLFIASTDFGATFGPKVKLNQERGAFGPEISADRKGHVYVVWPDERDQEVPVGKRRFNSNIYFNRSEDFGKTWLAQDLRLNGGPEKGSNPNAPIMRAMPTIHSNERGRVYVIWYDTRGGAAKIYFRASPDYGKTWAEEVVLAKSPGSILSPLRLVADAQGHLYVAWVEKRGEATAGEFHVYVIASSDAAKTWSTPIQLNAVVEQALFPHLAADDRGHVYVAWHDARHGGRDIYLNASLDFGKSWLPREIRLNSGPPGEAEAQFPQIAIDDKGYVVVVWQENRGAAQLDGIYLTGSADFGRTWLKQDIRVSEGQGPSLQPQIVPLPNAGTFVIAWETEAEGRKDVAVRIFPVPGPAKVTE